MKLLDFIRPEAIVPQLASTDRDGVLSELVDGLIKAKAAPPELRDELLAMIIDRETKGSTGFGKGVAVPHVKHPTVQTMAAAVGISQAGVDFNALDKLPVFTVVLLLSPENQPDQHLQAMENIFSNLQKDAFRRFLRQSTTAEQVLDTLQDADSQHLYG